MFNRRLKQLRLARGFSLEELAAKTGRIVTKQAISKYERGLNRPTVVVLNKLAEALNVKAAHVFSEPTVTVKFIAYRKSPTLRKKKQERIESFVINALEDRVHLQELWRSSCVDTAKGNNKRSRATVRPFLPVQSMPIARIEEAETAAERLRNRWKLGLDEISNMTETLENHSVHVIEIRTLDKLDGISAVAYDEKKKIKAAAVANKLGVSGERQRLNLAHELGHLVLDIPNNVNEERAAFRFGGAFLAPAEILHKEVGFKRAFIQPEELFMLKQRFGLSIAAFLYRLHDLEIISDSYYRKWCIALNRFGWKRREPYELKPEHSSWVRRIVLRGLSEGFLTGKEAIRFLGESIKYNEPFSLMEKKAFLKLPLEERRRRLAEQAVKLSSHYNENPEMSGVGGGDFAD